MFIDQMEFIPESDPDTCGKLMADPTPELRKWIVAGGIPGEHLRVLFLACLKTRALGWIVDATPAEFYLPRRTRWPESETHRVKIEVPGALTCPQES